MEVDVKGMDKLLAELKRIETTSDDDIADVINETLITTQYHAQAGIRGGPTSGVTYYRIPGETYMTIRAGSAAGPPVAFIPGGGSHNLSPIHKASAPGEYPQTDTGRLVSSVAIEPATANVLVGRVGTNLEYGPWLEFGTRNMAPRPWLNPSFEKAKVDVEENLKRKFESR